LKVDPLPLADGHTLLGLLAGSIAVESFQKRVIATSAELLGITHPHRDPNA
jgi:hypothetical protein